jgi:drug/metabolite transporter (DMT)-like permease
MVFIVDLQPSFLYFRLIPKRSEMLMQTAVLFALLSMVLVGVADFVYKRAAFAGALPSSFLVVQSWFFGPTAIVFGLATGNLRFHPSLFLGPVAAAVIFAAARMFLISLGHGEATVNTPIFRLNFVVTVALAIFFLDEQFTLRKLAGFVLAATSILLLTGFSPRQFVREGFDHGKRKSIVLALAAMGCMGLLNFIYAIAARLGATGPSFIFSQFCGFALIAHFHALCLERRLRLDRSVWTNAPLSGICGSAGLICLIMALNRGEASVAVPISQMSFVVTMILAVIAYSEGFTVRKSAGLIAALLTILAFK